MTVRIKLLITSPLSRLTNSNGAPSFKVAPRIANNVNAAPT